MTRGSTDDLNNFRDKHQGNSNTFSDISKLFISEKNALNTLIKEFNTLKDIFSKEEQEQFKKLIAQEKLKQARNRDYLKIEKDNLDAEKKILQQKEDNLRILTAKTKESQKQADKQAKESQKQADKQAKEEKEEQKRRDKVFNSFSKKFGSSKIAEVFRDKFVSKDGTLKEGGQFTSDALQAQDKFIRKLVFSLGQLPIFNKIGQGFSQLGRILFLKSLSDFKKGNIGDGLGALITASVVAAAPVMGQWIGNVAGYATGNLVAEALSNKMGTLLTKLLTVLPATLLVATGLMVAGITYGLSKDLDKLAKSRSGKQAEITKTASRSTKFYGIVAGVAIAIAGIFSSVLSPIALTCLGIAAGISAIASGMSYVVGRYLPDILESSNKLSNWWKKHMPSWLGGDNSPNKPNSNVTVGNEKIVSAQGNVASGKAQRFTSGNFDIVRFGNSQGQRGTRLNGSIYSKSELENMGRSGRGGLETLVAGGGVSVDSNSFTNDGRVARVGSSAILKAAQSKMATLGYGNMVLTSATASSSSGHAQGKLGHSGGQKFDINGRGMSEGQAVNYAKNLQSTGYFSHAEAEYDKGTKQWHIDARVSDESYKKLEKLQKKETQTENRGISTVPKPKQAPTNKALSQVVNESMCLPNGIYKKANTGVN